MSEATYNVTSEDIRKDESKESRKHDGAVPKESDPSIMKSILAENTESKQEKIDRVQANLPLPDQPPTASDWSSASADKVNVGSGRDVTSGISTGAANDAGLDGAQSTRDPDISGVGRQGVEGTSGPPPGI